MGQAVPRWTRVGRHDLGPGGLTRLAARALLAVAAGAGPETQLTVPGGGDRTVLEGRDDLRRLRFHNTWSVFPPHFEGQRLLRQARWQTWSAAPA